MILTGQEIIKQVKKKRITLSNFDESNINPNSYNLTLGDYVKVYEEDVLDFKKQNKTKIIPIPDEGLVLQPNKIYLGATKEVVGSDYFVPILTGRSSTARLGLFVHITADLIDIGSKGNLTFQMHAVEPLRIYKNLKIGQVMFWCVKGKIVLYKGKYQGSVGPQESKVWMDFKEGSENKWM